MTSFQDTQFQRDLHSLHTSDLLVELVAIAPEEFFTLEWLVRHLPKRSFGVILLFLAFIAMLPVISIPARFVILFLLGQIVVGYQAPVLPDRLLAKKLPSRYLKELNRYAIPFLKRLEQVVRPRWPSMLVGTRRVAAFVAILLTLVSLIAPIPLANVPPAAISVMLALAYIEHDGLLFTFALILAIALLGIVSAVFI